ADGSPHGRADSVRVALRVRIKFKSMIATPAFLDSRMTDALPNSRRVYVSGVLHPDVKVPMREISLSPTTGPRGETEVNPALRVYDTSGPWGDPDFHGDVRQGLPPLRREWILRRGDVEEYEGRRTTPQDN